MPDRKGVGQAVEQQGFYAGEPLGAGDCAGCHAEIAAQWAQSAHRFASFNNPYYAASVESIRDERTPASARFCAGCHDPLLLVDDTIAARELNRKTPAAQAGLPCLVCHSLHDAAEPDGPVARVPGSRDGRLGNASYTVRATDVPPPAGKGEPIAAGQQSPHGRRLRPARMATPTFCATCHKVGLLPEVTQDQWLRGQNDYDAWQASVAGGNGVGAVYRPDHVEVKRCQDCHMPLEKLRSGQLVRSHRFLAANAALGHLRDDPEQVTRTTEFLRGAVSLDLAVLRPRTGTTDAPGSADEASFAARVPLRPAELRDGALSFDVVLRNRRVGHRFPGGTNDSNDVWVEVELRDPASGRALRDATHKVRAQPVDAEGEPLHRRDPQHQRAVVYDASLSPADPQVVRYRADVRTLVRGRRSVTLELSARLLYRKFTPDYAAFSCERLPATVDAATRARCLSPPVIEVAAARRQIAIGPGPGAVPVREPDEPGAPLWQRYLDHGLGLADGLVDQASAALPSLLVAEQLAPARPEPALGKARLALALGRTDDVLAAGARAETLRPDHPAHLWLRAQALYRTYRFTEARPYAERAAVLVPTDRSVLALLARVRGLCGDAAGALAAADRLLALDPESEDGHHQRLLALRELGRPAAAIDAAEQSFLYYRRPVERDQELRQHFRARHPAYAGEDTPAHLHQLKPAPADAP